MAKFSDVPTEIVGEIAGWVMPGEIGTFSQVSKRIYVVALPFLKEHRELKERYSAFDNLERNAFNGRSLQEDPVISGLTTRNCTPGSTLSNLLIDVLANGRVARYIKEIRLEGWLSGWVYEQQEHVPYPEEHFVLFKQALSKYVLPTKLEEWIKDLEAGHESPVISLLLILLPNLNSIKFEHCSNMQHQLREVIERIRTDCIPGIPVLNHFERINLHYINYYKEAHPRPIDFLAFLATIPSLKSLYCQGISTSDGAHDFSCVTPRSSNITHLGFKRCNISLTKLEDLMQGPKALLEFHYIYDEWIMKPFQLEHWHQWDPAGMCKLLLNHAQGSLKVLDLRSQNTPVGPIEGLQNFEVLEELIHSLPSLRGGPHFNSQILAAQLPKSVQKISLHHVEEWDLLLLEIQYAKLQNRRTARLGLRVFVSMHIGLTIHTSRS